MNKLFYIFGGMLAATFFTACSEEKPVQATEPVAVTEEQTTAPATEPAATTVKEEAVASSPFVDPGQEDAEAVAGSELLKSAETNLGKALKAAQAEDRLVFVEFTGSDWCPPCKALRKNILSTPEFAEFVKSKNAIFVELDFPRTPGKVTPEVMQEREKIMLFYGIQGFPSMLVLDKNGAAYTKIVGGARKTPEYVQKMEVGCELQEKFSAAIAAAQGNTEALVGALNLLPPEFQAHQKGVIDSIIQADKEDRFGFAAKRKVAALEVEQREMIKAFFMKHSGKGRNDIEPARLEALELLKNPELLPAAKSALYKFISDGYAMQGKLPKTLEYLKQARDFAPNEKIKNNLARWVEHLEKIVNEKSQAVPAEKTPEAKPAEADLAPKAKENPQPETK